jgi:arylsulfatase A-like enzyme
MLAVVLSFDRFPKRLLGCYGNDLHDTPCLNRIAAESVVFDQHFADDLTPAPEGHAFWSGCHHFPRHGTPLVSRMPSLPLLLRSGNVDARWITESGDVPEVAIPKPCFDSVHGPLTEDLYGEASRQLEAWSHSSNTPRMLWMLEDMPLGPWGSEENAKALDRLDQKMEPLWQTISTLVKTRRVLFVLTSAAGRSLRERAMNSSADPTWSEEFVHLPLIIWHSEVGGGERREELTQPMDLPATLLDFFGVEQPSLIEGRSLLPSVLGQGQNGRQFITSGCRGSWDAIRDKDYHLVRMQGSDNSEGDRRFLFRKPEDVWDRHDVSAQEPEMTETLSRQLDAFLSAAKNELPVNDSVLDFPGKREDEGLADPS